MARISGKPELIKKINMSLIRKAITENSPITKPQLSKKLNLSLPTVNKAVDELLKEKVVKICQNVIKVKGSGKKPIFYEINGDCITVLTAYFNNNTLFLREYNLLSEIKNEKIINTQNGITVEKFLKYLDEMFLDSVSKKNITAISVGIPGVIEKNDCISGAHTLKDFNGINLKKIIEDKYGIKVVVENDANLITMGILEKLDPKIENLIYLFLSRGIGTGIIIDNKLYKGKSNFAGEIGEILLLDGETIEEKYKSAIENRDKENLKKIINFILTVNISLLNPDIVIINSSIFKINQNLLNKIYIELKEKFGECNVPEIYLDEKEVENGIEGALKMAFLKSNNDFTVVGK